MRNDFENAARQKNALSLSAEVLLSGADELADALLYGAGGKKGFLKENILQSDEFLSAYAEARDSLSFAGAHLDGVPKETAPFVSYFRIQAERFASAYLLSAFCRKRTATGEPIRVSDFLENEGETENPRIAYMRNPYSDAAYNVFSKAVRGASVLYPSSFAAVCEEVYYGRAGYCILPYESSEDGVLPGFRRLISKYELRPLLTCPITTDTSVQSTTRFVLLSKNAARIDTDKLFYGKNLSEYLKITIGGPQENAFDKVLGAASICGLKCTKTESIPLPWDEGRYSSSLTFSLGTGDPVPFLLYLRLEVPESEIEGIYTDIVGA